MVLEQGMVLEVVLLAMLQHEQTTWLQNVSCEYPLGKGVQVRQLIGWVGEDEIEL